MRYFVCSEAELAHLVMAAMDAAHSYKLEEDHELLNDAKTACRARPFDRAAFAAICAEVDRQQKNGDFTGSFFEGICKRLFGDDE